MDELDINEAMSMLEGIDDLDLNTSVQNTQPVAPATPQPVVQQVPVQTTVTAPVQPTQPVVQPTQPVVQQVPVQTTVTAPVSNDVMEAQPVFVDMKKSLYTTQTDFFRLKDDERSRITLIGIKPGDIMMARTHYLNGLGYFHCLSEYADDGVYNIVKRSACCTERQDNDPTKFKRAAQKYLVPIIEYPVSRKDGKTINAGEPPKLKMFNMNRTEYLDLINILKDYATQGDDIYTADLTSFDLSVSVDKTKMFPVKKFGAMPSIRNQFGQAINTEIAKYNADYKATAWKEAFKNIPESQVANKLKEIEEGKLASEKLAAQQAPLAGSINFNV